MIFFQCEEHAAYNLMRPKPTISVVTLYFTRDGGHFRIGGDSIRLTSDT